MTEKSITFEQFEKHMRDLKTIFNFQDRLNGLALEYSTKCREPIGLCFPSLISNTIELLSAITGDSKKRIEYFIFDLNFGEWVCDPIESEVGNVDILKSNKDLWDAICRDNK